MCFGYAKCNYITSHFKLMWSCDWSIINTMCLAWTGCSRPERCFSFSLHTTYCAFILLSWRMSQKVTLILMEGKARSFDEDCLYFNMVWKYNNFGFKKNSVILVYRYVFSTEEWFWYHNLTFLWIIVNILSGILDFANYLNLFLSRINGDIQ